MPIEISVSVLDKEKQKWTHITAQVIWANEKDIPFYPEIFIGVPVQLRLWGTARGGRVIQYGKYSGELIATDDTRYPMPSRWAEQKARVVSEAFIWGDTPYKGLRLRPFIDLPDYKSIMKYIDTEPRLLYKVAVNP